MQTLLSYCPNNQPPMVFFYDCKDTHTSHHLYLNKFMAQSFINYTVPLFTCGILGSSRMLQWLTRDTQVYSVLNDLKIINK